MVGAPDFIESVNRQTEFVRETLVCLGARPQDVRLESTAYDQEADRTCYTFSAPVPVTDDPAIRLAFSGRGGTPGDRFTYCRPGEARSHVPQPATVPSPQAGAGSPEGASPFDETSRCTRGFRDRRADQLTPRDPGSPEPATGRGTGGAPSLQGQSLDGLVYDEPGAPEEWSF